MVGPGLASITPIILSLLLPDPFPRTFVLITCFLGLQAVESNILGPRIVGHAVGLHPVAAILSLLVGARLFGLFGALIATPLVAAAWVVITSIYRSAKGETAEQMLATHKRAAWTLRRTPREFEQEHSEENAMDAKDAKDKIRTQEHSEENAMDAKDKIRTEEMV